MRASEITAPGAPRSVVAPVDAAGDLPAKLPSPEVVAYLRTLSTSGWSSSRRVTPASSQSGSAAFFQFRRSKKPRPPRAAGTMGTLASRQPPLALHGAAFRPPQAEVNVGRRVTPCAKLAPSHFDFTPWKFPARTFGKHSVGGPGLSVFSGALGLIHSGAPTRSTAPGRWWLHGGAIVIQPGSDLQSKIINTVVVAAAQSAGAARPVAGGPRGGPGGETEKLWAAVERLCGERGAERRVAAGKVTRRWRRPWQWGSCRRAAWRRAGGSSARRCRRGWRSSRGGRGWPSRRSCRRGSAPSR